MKEHSWSLFTFPVMDIKAAQDLLDRRAEEGWTLDRVYLGSFARFMPAQRRERWAVDWVRYGKGERQDYLALCQEAGWTFVQRVGSFHLYRAEPGAVPIQTDPAEELRRFRGEVLLRWSRPWAILSGIALALIALALWLDGVQYTVLFFLLSNAGLFALLSLPLLAAGAAAWLLRLVLRLGQWRRAVEEGDPLPGPGPASARAMAWLCLAARLWLSIFFAFFLLDILKEGNVGNALGLFIGTLAGLSHRRKRMEKEGRVWPAGARSSVLLYGLILAAALACPFLRPATNAIPPASPLAEGTFWPGADRLDQDFGDDFLRPTFLEEPEPVDEGSFGLRHQRWWEFRGEEQIDVHCYTARWEWLSRLVLALEQASWLPALDGVSGAWLHQAGLGGGDVESQLLLKGGRSVLEIYGRGRPLAREDILTARDLLAKEG